MFEKIELKKVNLCSFCLSSLLIAVIVISLSRKIEAQDNDRKSIQLYNESAEFSQKAKLLYKVSINLSDKRIELATEAIRLRDNPSFEEKVSGKIEWKRQSLLAEMAALASKVEQVNKEARSCQCEGYRRLLHGMKIDLKDETNSQMRVKIQQAHDDMLGKLSECPNENICQ